LYLNVEMAKRFTRSSKMINTVQISSNTIYEDNNVSNVTTKKRKINNNMYIQSAKRAGMSYNFFSYIVNTLYFISCN